MTLAVKAKAGFLPLGLNGTQTTFILTRRHVQSSRVSRLRFSLPGRTALIGGGPHIPLAPDPLTPLRTKGIGRMELTAGFVTYRLTPKEAMKVVRGLEFMESLQEAAGSSEDEREETRLLRGLIMAGIE